MGKTVVTALSGSSASPFSGALAGTDVNDADRLSLGTVMRWIVGGHADMQQAASTSQMARMEVLEGF